MRSVKSLRLLVNVNKRLVRLCFDFHGLKMSDLKDAMSNLCCYMGFEDRSPLITKLITHIYGHFHFVLVIVSLVNIQSNIFLNDVLFAV